MGRRSWTFSVVLLGVLLCTPSIDAAAAAEGTLLIEGVLSLPPETRLDASLLGLYAGDASNLATLRLEAAHASVTRHTWHRTDVSVMGRHFTQTGQHDVATYPLDDLTLELASGNHTGPLLLVPLEALRLSAAEAPVALRASPPSHLGDGSVSTREQAEPRRPQTAVNVVHVQAESAGAVAVEGFVELTLFGPDVAMVAAQNATNVRTGHAGGGSTGVGERQEIALVVRAYATVVLEGAPAVMALGEAVLGTQGMVLAERANGAIGTPDGRYQAMDGPASFTGAFTLLARPVSPAAMHVELEGVLQASSLPLQAPVAGPASAWYTQILLVAVALASGAAGAFAARVALRRRGAHDAEHWTALAEDAMEAGQWATALERLDKASALAPRSTRLALNRAHVLHQLGRLPEALAAYDAMGAGLHAADAAFQAIHVLVAMGRTAEAADRLVRLLEEHPVFAGELDDPRLDVLHLDRAVQAALRRARLRLDDV